MGQESIKNRLILSQLLYKFNLLQFTCIMSPLLLLFVYTAWSMEYSNDCSIVLLDESYTEYMLILIGNIIAITFAHEWIDGSVLGYDSIFLYRWIYDPHTQTLMTSGRSRTDICLAANLDSFTLLLANCSLYAQNQRFVYNQAEKELFWINQAGKQHPIYLEKDDGRTFKSIPYFSMKPFISRNPISHQMLSKPRGTRLRALALRSLQTALPKMSSIEYQKYLKILESLNEPEFSYFINEQNRYLLSDGHTVTALKWCRFQDVNYKYYGLWHVNENNHLVHFLSGKYLQAIPNYLSRNVELLDNMLPPRHSRKAMVRMNRTVFYDLKLCDFSKELTHMFVTVKMLKERHEMYINNNGRPQKIENAIIAHGANAYLAFVSNSTYQKIWKYMRLSIRIKASEMTDNS